MTLRLHKSDLYRHDPDLARRMWDAGFRPRRVNDHVQEWQPSRVVRLLNDLEFAWRWIIKPMVVVALMVVLLMRGR